MHRDTLTTNPREGDYVLSPTGFTWNILRRGSDHNGFSVTTGDRDKKDALAKLRALAEADRADGWETAAIGLFWHVARFRP